MSHSFGRKSYSKKDEASKGRGKHDQNKSKDMKNDQMSHAVPAEKDPNKEIDALIKD